AHLRTKHIKILLIRSLSCEQCRRKSFDLSAKRESLAHARKDSTQTCGHDQRVGGRTERDLSLPGRCGFSALRSRRLPRCPALCQFGTAKTSFHVARIRRALCSRFARKRDRSVGIDRGEPNGAHARDIPRWN